MNMKAALLLVFLVFAFASILVTSVITFNIPTFNAASLAEALVYSVNYKYEPTGDGVGGGFLPH